ncbi:hypothetical protein EV715DRAFT_265211 [Schizophyllum commune]
MLNTIKARATGPRSFTSSVRTSGATRTEMALSVDVAYMWGIVISSFLYGVYLVMFCIALYILLLPLQPSYRARREPVNRVLHFIAQCLRMGYAYVEHIEHPGTQPPFLEDLSHPLAIVTGVCFTVAAILTDALTIYRLYMIWARNIWVCVAPALTLVGMMVCGFVMCAVTQEAGSEVMLYGTSAGYWLIATFIVGLCTNFVALGLIIVRFTKRDRAQPESARGVGGISLVITVIIESTLIYSGTKFINLMLLIAQSNVSYTFFCIVIPVIGIASHLLIIHVGYEKYFKPLTSHGPFSSERAATSIPMQVRSPTRSQFGDRSSKVSSSFIDFDTPEDSQTAGKAFDLTPPLIGPPPAVRGGRKPGLSPPPSPRTLFPPAPSSRGLIPRIKVDADVDVSY